MSFSKKRGNRKKEIGGGGGEACASVIFTSGINSINPSGTRITPKCLPSCARVQMTSASSLVICSRVCPLAATSSKNNLSLHVGGRGGEKKREVCCTSYEGNVWVSLKCSL